MSVAKREILKELDQMEECAECGEPIDLANDEHIHCEDCGRLCCSGCSYGDYCPDHNPEFDDEDEK